MEKRTKVREIGSYNPKTQKYEDTFRYEDTGEPVVKVIDVHKTPVIGNYDAEIDEYETAYEDRDPDDTVDLTEDK